MTDRGHAILFRGFPIRLIVLIRGATKHEPTLKGMNMLNWKKSILALSLATLVAAPIAAQEPAVVDQDTANATAETAARDAATPVFQDAIDALKETDTALKALGDGDKDAALAALERAIGKLEVTLAQNPDMALVPVDVNTTVLDVASSPEAINAAKREALRLMKDHQLQLARVIISSLASEIDIDVTYIPLATYPLALKSAVALIGDDKIDDATTVLYNALSTLVVARDVQPLPFLRAGLLIDEAATLSEKTDRDDDENARLSTLLAAIDTEIAIGEALEYGDKDAFEPLKEQMLEIRAKTDNGGAGTGFFTRLKDLFGGLGRDHSAAAN
ncbi:MAG TPA: YfdX family protein [Aliiroseovarius sp.]|nr:YfdX family protein [Aliiroseovarius sp.]